MAIQLSLSKDEAARNRLRLSMLKGSLFKIVFSWDSAHDPDVHALLCHNDGSGAKARVATDILSTYNCKKTNSGGALLANPDGSFSTPCGTLRHSGDARTGLGKDEDEIIYVDVSKLSAHVNEIPFFVTIHKSENTGATFADIKDAAIKIVDDSGATLGEFALTSEFAKFSACQRSSLMTRGPNMK